MYTNRRQHSVRTRSRASSTQNVSDRVHRAIHRAPCELSTSARKLARHTAPAKCTASVACTAVRRLWNEFRLQHPSHRARACGDGGPNYVTASALLFLESYVSAIEAEAPLASMVSAVGTQASPASSKPSSGARIQADWPAGVAEHAAKDGPAGNCARPQGPEEESVAPFGLSRPVSIAGKVAAEKLRKVRAVALISQHAGKNKVRNFSMAAMHPA
jgi:hypothetical protein